MPDITHWLSRLRLKSHPDGLLFLVLLGVITGALTSGHSVGREGPAVHLGAGIASQLGRSTRRVPSQLRLLAGCGAAAAISAAFDTPLAGVLFAMEVILMEYSLLGFTPIIAAAVTAAVCMRWFMGEHPVFLADHLVISAGIELPLLILTGLAIGLVAVVFHHLTRWFRQLWPGRRNARLLLAGVITGTLALWVPEVLGTGFDTVNATLTHQIGWSVLMFLLFAKIIATAAAVGLSIPAGVIGPTLVIGACAGAVIAHLAPGNADPAFYALLGMAAMMSAVLHAPLAALLAVLELSLNAHAVFPAMIVVLGANLVCQHGFRLPSLFGSLLAAQGLRIETHPVRTALAQRYLSELTTRQYVLLPRPLDASELTRMSKQPIRWLAIPLGDQYYLVNKETLAQTLLDWLQTPEDSRPSLEQMLTERLPGFSRLEQIDADITLLEAVKWLHRNDTAGFLLPLPDGNQGLVTRSQLVSVLTSEGDIQ